jgi:hypothetical protein
VCLGLSRWPPAAVCPSYAATLLLYVGGTGPVRNGELLLIALLFTAFLLFRDVRNACGNPSLDSTFSSLVATSGYFHQFRVF